MDGLGELPVLKEELEPVFNLYMENNIVVGTVLVNESLFSDLRGKIVGRGH